jgi:multidrug efflux system outer membrane protein
MKPPILLFSVALLASGCTVGPNYKRPTVAVPGLYRGTVSTEAAPTQLAALGDQKWWDIFQDEQLRTLICTALTQNYDSRIAASRVLEAQAQLGIIRADQFPSVGAGAGMSDTRTAQSKFLPAFETSTGQVNLAAAWELDFWGKCRRATEAARANLIASEWARREVLSTLVANVASAYFQLRALDLQLEISKRTLNSRQESLRLTRSWQTEVRRRCSTCAKPSSWFLRQAQRFQFSNSR